jgi:DNA mismatch repair protein MutL
MGEIRVLPDAVVNQIAAGEVVERPASVAKELVENAVDAGATQITVTLKEGGRDLVSVLDNGRGMDESDALLSVQRHATSKIASADELTRIATLGFRGEALASIAAVSRFELVTCASEQAGAVCLKLEEGRAEPPTHQGFPRGTRVTCADLFFNTPARRKFLRSASTEFQYTQGVLAQLALAHPQVHFRIQHNAKPVASWPATESLAERVLQVFGPELHEGLAEVMGQEGLLAFQGLVSLPSHARSSRRWQHLFLNGRPIRNPGLNHAVYHAYRTLLMKDRHPAFILRLGLHPSEVDVNVHPAKTEVRLRNPQWAHTVLADKLHRALLEAGRRQAFGEGVVSLLRPNAAPLSPLLRPNPASRASVLGTGSGGAEPTRWVSEAVPSHAGRGEDPPGWAVRVGGRDAPGSAARPGALPDGRGWAAAAGAAQAAEREGRDAAAFHFHPLTGAGPLTPEGAASIPARGLFPYRGLGADSGAQEPLALPLGVQVLCQLHTTYILAQRESGLVVIDQHAAHERILFEQYRGQFLAGTLKTERFLVPPTFELSPQTGVLLDQYLPQWKQLGFEIEPFGRNGYLVREAPALLAGQDLKAMVLEVLDELALFGKSGRLEEVLNEILERVACHAAIRAGMVLSRPEMEALVAQLEQLEINLYCPHGRPVWVEIGERELEKRFKRIV